MSFSQKEELTKAFIHLKDKGVKYVKVEYSGGGDSGDIDAIYYNLENPDEDLNTRHTLGINMEVHELIKNYSYYLTQDIEDWYNNDGGYGIIVIDVESANYTIENNVRYTDVETYDHEGDVEFD
jgi:hypothetical protein